MRADASGRPIEAREQNILEIAHSHPEFHALLASLQAAGLSETLATRGPFTLFAPTNAAFARLAADRLDDPTGDHRDLAELLACHIVPGRVTATEAMDLDSVETLHGSPIRFDAANGVRVNDARLLRADILAKNGVIHVIDRVIQPRATSS